MPFVAPIENTTAAENSYNYIVNGNGNTVNNQFIDNENGVVTNIKDDSTTQQFDIDYITYNFDDHSYTVNTYNYDNDTYTYYTWNYTYNITNTYYTYIGTSAEYQNTAYEFYYELPDGRSSADLTAEEIAGMSFQFTDVVNYERSATDTSLRTLYHFDGNTDDAGYFSTQTEFTWNEGASITYMDSGVFEGCLYLDNIAHSFTMTLPSGFTSGDFSLQFRYYQASEPDTQDNIENVLSFGSTAVLKWDEASLYNGSGTKLCALPIGSWMELALIRSSGTLYYCLNGIQVGSVSSSSSYGQTITFVLGSTSRAYSQLDELRFVNFAVAEDGKSYTCTSVPYDTNSVLVLPGGAFPIADEYYEFNTESNLLSYGTDFSSGGSSLLYSSASTSTSAAKWYSSNYPYACFSGADSCVSLEYDSNFSSLIGNSDADTAHSSASPVVPYMRAISGGLVFPVGYLTSSTKHTVSSDYPIDTYDGLAETYVFSIFDRNLTPYSFVFSPRGSTVSYNGTRISLSVLNYPYLSCYEEEYEWGYIRFYLAGTDSSSRQYFFVVVPKADVTFDFVYVELVKGTVPSTGHKFVSCLYSSLDLKPNTAAVQSDIPVNGYTVGGVRPTFPQRGDVWFPVSGSRITGCYVYTGSMWQEAGCRYYTGKRWIPIYALDIYTMADCWDTADGGDVQQTITSEYNFWNWWQKSWTDFRTWLSANWTGSPGSSGGSSINEDDFPVDTPSEGEEEDGFSIFDLLIALKDGSWKIVKGVVSIGADGISGLVSSVGDIGTFFNAYSGQGGIFDIENFGGDDIWD